MSNEMLQKAIDLVSSLEVKNETQQIAKYELIEYTERLHKENQELKKQLENCYCNRIDCVGRIKDSKLYDSLVQKIENQQKEFIEYLEAEKDRLARECSQIYEDSLGKTRLVSEDIFNELNDVLSKYKKIVGYKE